MEELSAVKVVVNRSRFFAHLYRLESREEMDKVLKQHRRDYKKAVHHCHALRLSDGGRVEQSKSDGEVGQPGKVLLELLKKHELEQHALVVSRIFGGVKLGIGGVSRAFREAGEAAVQHYLAKVKM